MATKLPEALIKAEKAADQAINKYDKDLDTTDETLHNALQALYALGLELDKQTDEVKATYIGALKYDGKNQKYGKVAKTNIFVPLIKCKFPARVKSSKSKYNAILRYCHNKNVKPASVGTTITKGGGIEEYAATARDHFKTPVTEKIQDEKRATAIEAIEKLSPVGSFKAPDIKQDGFATAFVKVAADGTVEILDWLLKGWEEKDKAQLDRLLNKYAPKPKGEGRVSAVDKRKNDPLYPVIEAIKFCTDAVVGDRPYSGRDLIVESTANGSRFLAYLDNDEPWVQVVTNVILPVNYKTGRGIGANVQDLLAQFWNKGAKLEWHKDEITVVEDGLKPMHYRFMPEDTIGKIRDLDRGVNWGPALPMNGASMKALYDSLDGFESKGKRNLKIGFEQQDTLLGMVINHNDSGFYRIGDIDLEENFFDIPKDWDYRNTLRGLKAITKRKFTDLSLAFRNGSSHSFSITGTFAGGTMRMVF